MCHETFHSYFPSASCPHLLRFSSGHPSFNSVSLFPLVASCHPQMNSMNSVSSSEDIKPPPGLQNMGNINYQCTSPGGMSKHICAICGDRSSGNVRGGRRRKGKYIHTQITEGNIKDLTHYWHAYVEKVFCASECNNLSVMIHLIRDICGVCLCRKALRRVQLRGMQRLL